MSENLNLNWSSEESFLLLNNRLPDSVEIELKNLYQKYQEKGHIWLTSSGSTTAENHSVKLIALGKTAILNAAKSVNLFLNASKHDRWLNVLPCFHIGGLAIHARAALSESSLFESSNQRWNPLGFVEQVREQKITLTSLVPTQIYDLVQSHSQCPESIRYVLVGGGMLSENLYLEARKLGWPLLLSYGMTETCAAVAIADPNQLEKNNPQLVPLSHCQFTLNHDDFLQIKSNSLLTGFAQMRNGESFWETAVQDGWYTTDDRAIIGKESIKILGRGKDYVKIKGEGVNLAYLQSMLEKIVFESIPDNGKELVITKIQNERTQYELILLHTNQISEENIKLILRRYNDAVMPYEKIENTRLVPQFKRTSLGKIILPSLEF